MTHLINTRTQQGITRLNLKLVLFLFFILPLVTCPLWGQVVQKRHLKMSEYSKWGELRPDTISVDGKWVSYRISYEGGKDTLFIRSTLKPKTYNFPKGQYPKFMGNNHIMFKDEKSRYILNLSTGKIQSFPKSTQIAYSYHANNISVLSKDKSSLQIINLATNAVKIFDNINAFEMSKNGKEILITTFTDKKYSIGLINLSDTSNIKWIITGKPYPFSNFAWEEKGKAVAFYSFSDSDSKDTNLYFYILESQKLSSLNLREHDGFSNEKIFDKNMIYPSSISPDLKSVFFGIVPNNKQSGQKNKDSVEVWNTADRWIYALEQRSGKFNEKSSLALWHPAGDTILEITSAELPKVLLTGDKAFAIISNPKAYEPQFEADGPRDFYIVNLKSGEKAIMLKKQSEYYADVLPSPSGKFVAYFKDNNWWIYDIGLKKHTNITKNIQVPFAGRMVILNSENAFGCAGWSAEDNEILLYDQYDIWAVTPDGKSFRRITAGREKGIKFRINAFDRDDLYLQNYDGVKSTTIDLNKEIILRAVGDDGKSGYYNWKKKNKVNQIVYFDGYADKIQYTENHEIYFYCEQRFDLSPRLVMKKKNDHQKILFQSNPQQEKYYWGTSELITFHNSKGRELKGILYYPANYDRNKKYPMIVHIYEKQSEKIHHYVNPTLYCQDGYNPSVMTANGYFVVCPDIFHEKGTVGENTVDCTVSAVQNIISRNLVDSKRIGLIGHSFGGYEVNFIVTQTNLFAAAISGSSIADLTSYYLNIGWSLSISDMTRFQSTQWRIGKTPFEDPALYAKNSPVANASYVKTPLLMWAGKEDSHTNWHQTVEFYMAFRRLNKSGIMLLYPGEKHVLLKSFNQENLSLKVTQWFDYYLKNDLSVKWINKTN